MMETLSIPTQVYHTFTVFPGDLNFVGTLFGGKTLAEMDIVAAKLCQKLLRFSPTCKEAVTVSVERVNFEKPGRLGDTIDLQARLSELGKSSISMHVMVEREDAEGLRERICTAKFKFVAVKDGKAHPHGLEGIVQDSY